MSKVLTINIKYNNPNSFNLTLCSHALKRQLANLYIIIAVVLLLYRES